MNSVVLKRIFRLHVLLLLLGWASCLFAQDPPLRGITKLNATPSSQSQRGKNYLFVVGIDNYQKWLKLGNAVSDAKGANLCQTFAIHTTASVATPVGRVLDWDSQSPEIGRLLTRRNVQGTLAPTATSLDAHPFGAISVRALTDTGRALIVVNASGVAFGQFGDTRSLGSIAKQRHRIWVSAIAVLRRRVLASPVGVRGAFGETRRGDGFASEVDGADPNVVLRRIEASAEPVLFHHGDAEAGLRQQLRQSGADHARAGDDDIAVSARHRDVAAAARGSGGAAGRRVPWCASPAGAGPPATGPRSATRHPGPRPAGRRCWRTGVPGRQ